MGTEHRIPHRLACQVLGVSESWFYKWRDKPTTAREVRRGQLTAAIRQIFEDSGATYGSPKVDRVPCRGVADRGVGVRGCLPGAHA
ncbi:hypothetical protein [Streptomyces sp. NPDC126514]|uniref:hypothetical protein n=1 Tax=Streptomyces sp. NPDC126514 TaxID=3155210 RepID=UPI00331AE3CC